VLAAVFASAGPRRAPSDSAPRPTPAARPGRSAWAGSRRLYRR